MFFMRGLSGLYILTTIGLIVLSIYSLILFIKLATRGIKALDIYIDKNTY